MTGETAAAGGHQETPLVGALADFGAADVAAAGGKGANLGELVRAGFPVPGGFVVTTAAYAALLAETGLGASLAELLRAGVDGERIRGAFAAVRMPEAVRGAITAAYRQRGGGPVAVRSSATTEDLPGAAFAGAQETYLNVVDEDAVIDAVARCWASLWTDRALAYRRHQGIDEDDLAIAVVVEDMVPADVAGVMFTANPVTGRRDETVVEAGRGLGEAVVSGRVTPERYVLSRGRLTEWTPGGQETVIRVAAGGGTDAAPGERRTRPILTRQQLTRLADLARQTAAHFGRPQDLEWAISAGRVYLLQARPMTALPPEPLALNPVQRKVAPFFVEMFQERPYPLDVSGWLQHGILDMLGRMAGSIGVVFPSASELLPEEDGVVLRLVPPVPRPTVRALAAPVSVLRRVRRFDPSTWTHDPRFAAFLREAERLRAQDPRQLDWPGLLSLVRQLFDALRPISELRVSYLPGSFLPQLTLRLALLALGKRRLAPALIAGAQTRTSQANRDLAALADHVRADDDLRRAFARLDPPDLLPLLSGDPRFAELARRLDAFLGEYGHRETVSLLLVSSPTWSDAPEVVLGLVKALTHDGGPAVDQTGDALRELTAHPALRNATLRRHVLGWVQAAKTGTGFREDTHFYATMVLPPLRRALLELGDRLRAAGVLDQAADVFHLRFEELTAIRDAGALAPEERDRLRVTVLARAAKRRELAGLPLLDLDALFADRATRAGALLTGSGASRGTATGAARIVRGPADFARLRGGEVLVCPYTNPSWTPLFQRAAAVVVDAGGLGSHAAIVAREYGIPAVMGTGNGTRALRDGQRVTVDGTTGLVTAAPDER
ncbi:PEP/pyruvate-binding domain-containing protein [Georgenia sp. SYP-B2076]|uniref:PEP/pyruvate-binding domain-containing protein n=1 Tax=Georgenia sp. SYP-B2076 TaxID=2495881 RepID=UPI000F8D077B|nr:PEP/pyruvate-binding domain-containing protein [Georgenia sp. SYP-B2076]